MEAVVVDDVGVRRPRADGTVESVRWAELDEVAIVTTGDGPFCEDVFFVLRERDRGVIVAHAVACAIDLLPWLQRLPGFDDEVLIDAMASTDDARFVCYRRAPQNPAEVTP